MSRYRTTFHVLRLTLLWLVCLWFCLLIGYHGRLELSRVLAQHRAKPFFESLAEENWEKAARYMAGSEAAKKEAWVERIKQLKAEGYYLVDYDRLWLEVDDGACCIGHVRLSFEHEGRREVVQAVFTVGSSFTIGQVYTLLHSEDEPLPMEWRTLNTGF